MPLVVPPMLEVYCELKLVPEPVSTLSEPPYPLNDELPLLAEPVVVPPILDCLKEDFSAEEVDVAFLSVIPEEDFPLDLPKSL